MIARRRHSGYYFAVWTLILWTFGMCATILSSVVFGLTFGPLMFVGLGLYLAGIATFVTGWDRVP